MDGRTYIKTDFIYGERPLASAKLNQWDDRIESAMETLSHFLAHTGCRQDGIVRTNTSNSLQVTPTSPQSLSVEVQEGSALIKGLPFVLAQVVSTATVTPPATYDRIDLVQAELTDWSISIKTGSESSSPTPPSPDSRCLALAQLYLRPGMTSIKASDDLGNGYIIDIRSFL